jgi:ketosteroid isomerase-like protein
LWCRTALSGLARDKLEDKLDLWSSGEPVKTWPAREFGFIWASMTRAMNDTLRPMAERNADIVGEMYAAFNRGDLAAALQMIDPEPELHQPPEVVDSESYYGLEACLRGFSLFTEEFDEPRLEPQEVEEVDDCVLMRVRVSGKAKVTGLELETHFFHAWSLRDGRPQCCVVRSSRSEALGVLKRLRPSD